MDIDEWVRNRKVVWNKHINTTYNGRLAKTVRDVMSPGQRRTELPKKKQCDNLNLDLTDSKKEVLRRV